MSSAAQRAVNLAADLLAGAAHKSGKTSISAHVERKDGTYTAVYFGTGSTIEEAIGRADDAMMDTRDAAIAEMEGE